MFNSNEVVQGRNDGYGDMLESDFQLGGGWLVCLQYSVDFGAIAEGPQPHSQPGDESSLITLDPICEAPYTILSDHWRSIYENGCATVTMRGHTFTYATPCFADVADTSYVAIVGQPGP